MDRWIKASTVSWRLTFLPLVNSLKRYSKAKTPVMKLSKVSIPAAANAILKGEGKGRSARLYGPSHSDCRRGPKTRRTNPVGSLGLRCRAEAHVYRME